MKPFKLSRTLLSILVAQTIPFAAFAADAGNLEGQLQREKDKRPVAGAEIVIKESGAKTITSSNGSYIFRDLSLGTYTLVVKTNGVTALEKTVTISADKTSRQDLDIGAAMNALETITVMAQFAPYAIARAAQQEAPNLVNITTADEMRKLPDVSTAETVRRLPGISLETDTGEGRFINIRGLDADLNSTTFGGLRLPPSNNATPFSGGRAVALDAIPTGLVGALTVTKTNLPEQDAEALGGTIEITPKTAPRNGAPFIQGNVGTGREDLRGTNITDLSVTAGGRWGGSAPNDSGIVAYKDRPFSIVVTAAYYEDKRGIDDVEPSFLDDGASPTNALGSIDQRLYQYNRKRHGFGVDLGYQPDANSSYYLRGFDAGYTETVHRNRLTINLDGSPTVLSDKLVDGVSFQKTLRDEKEKISNQVFVVGGKNILGEQTIDYRLGYTKGGFKKYYDYNSTFDSSVTGTIRYNNSGPSSTPRFDISALNYLDSATYKLSRFQNSTSDIDDHEWSPAANWQLPVNWGGFENESFKVGATARLRERTVNGQPYSFAANPLALTSAVSGGNVTFYEGNYQNGQNINTGYLQGVVGPQLISASNRTNSALQFQHDKEDVYAAYGQYQATLGKFGVIGGVRIEDTKASYDANAKGVDAAGNAFIAPVSANKSYVNFFPSLQGRYEIDFSLIARASFSSTIARPGFIQINPSLNINPGAGTVAQGNPGLKPTTAYNLDVSIEKYLPHAGILSLGLFDKEISNYIANNLTNQTFPNNGLFAGFVGAARVFTYTNVSKARARGLEFSYEQRFTELPGALSGLGAGANWTIVNSRFEIRPNEFSALPSTSKNTVNATVFYEKYGLALRLGYYYTSRNLWAIGGPTTNNAGIPDVFSEPRGYVDFGSTYAFDKNLSIYFNAKNLSDTPLKFAEGSSDRPIQREFYGRTYQAGVRFDF